MPATSSPSTRARRRPAPSSSMRRLAPVGVAQQEFPQHLPAPRLGRARRRRRSGSTTVATVRAALREGRPCRRGHRRRSASPTSARRRSSGTARPASRSTTPSSGRTGAPPTSARALRGAGHEPAVAQQTGLLLDPYFSATKIAWLLDNVPGARDARRARRARLRHDRQLPALAADRRHACTRPTPPTRRARCCSTSRRGDWDDELLDAVPRAARRCCRRCATAPATSAPPIRTLFGAPIPILGIAGDQQAATVGQACFAPGMMKSTYGTGCFALLNTGDAPVRRATAC